MLPSTTLAVSVDRDWREVAAFVRDGARLADWAPGLGSDVRPDGDGWRVRQGDREVRVGFAPDNDLGVADHRVTGEGLDLLVPLRVVPNGAGAEVLLTVFRQPTQDDAAFAADLAAVRADLARLAGLLAR